MKRASKPKPLAASLEELARRVADYFGADPIPPFLNGDAWLRDSARALVGLPPVAPGETGVADAPHSDEPRRDVSQVAIQCGACGHRWTAVFLPMTLDRVVRVLHGVACPRCGIDASRLICGAGER